MPALASRCTAWRPRNRPSPSATPTGIPNAHASAVEIAATSSVNTIVLEQVRIPMEDQGNRALEFVRR